MKILLKKTDNSIFVYIDGCYATTFENASVEEVVNWVNKNLQYSKLMIT